MASTRRSGNGEGSVYEDGDRWVAAITLGKTGEGKPIRKKVYCATRKEAERARAEMVRLKEAGARLLTTKQTMREYTDYWLENVKAGQIRPGTLRVYRSILETHVYPVIGTRRLTKVRPEEIQALLNTVASSRSVRTAQLVLTLLRMVLAHAQKWELVPRNVAQLVESPRGQSPERVALTPTQARQLLLATAGMDDEGVYWTALLLGMRQGEILGLQWNDIDSERGVVRVRRSLIGTKGGEPAYGEPKSQAGYRTLYLSRAMIEVLDDQRRRQSIWEKEARLSGSAWVDFGLVFTNRWGGPINADTLRDHYQALLTRAGLPAIHFHDLRHAHQTLLAELGVPERTSMDLLGHRDVQTTRMVYTHASEAGKRQAALRIGEVFEDVRQTG